VHYQLAKLNTMETVNSRGAGRRHRGENSVRNRFIFEK
jgi:hypothetical protein